MIGWFNIGQSTQQNIGFCNSSCCVLMNKKKDNLTVCDCILRHFELCLDFQSLDTNFASSN